jgi:hypothetical protein
MRNEERGLSQLGSPPHAKPGQAGVALDWKAKWRTWCRNEAKWTAERVASRPRPGGIVAGTLEDIAALEGEI